MASVEDEQGRLTTDERWVIRPFTGRRDIRSADGQLLSSIITNDDGFYTYTNGQYHLVETGRHRPEADLRPLAVLSYGEQHGLVQRVRAETVVGRPCVTGRTGALPAEPLTSATSDQVEDLCVDSTGLVLREALYVSLKRVRLTTVTQVQTDVALPPEIFQPAPVGDRFTAPGVTSRELSPSEVAGPFVHLDRGSGFAAVAGSTTSTGGLGGNAAPRIVLFSTRGPDLVEVESQGGPVVPWSVSEGVTQTVPGVGPVHVVPALDVSEVRFEMTGAVTGHQWIRLRSALGPPELLSLIPSVRDP